MVQGQDLAFLISLSGGTLGILNANCSLAVTYIDAQSEALVDNFADIGQHLGSCLSDMSTFSGQLLTD